MPRATSTTVLLSWALDGEGRRTSIAALTAATRRTRGPFRCHGCGEELVAKLGPVRARHFAHRPGSTCALTRPETILHLDAKERLLALCARAFAGETRVTLLARCPACRRAAPIDLARAGDAAVSEGAVGTLRADVLVTRGGAPALALEVLVTHAVDAAKEAALARAGVPALEVDAADDGWLRDDGATAEVAAARGLGLPRCPACLAGDRAARGREAGGEAAQVAELEAYRARGLLGPRPGPPRDDAPPLAGSELQALGFRCPECGDHRIRLGSRLATHACGEGPARPVAWRGYDGALVTPRWWRNR